MISKCANPECGRPFRYLHEGKLVVVQSGDAVQGAQNLIDNVYFLCAECADAYTIVIRDARTVVVNNRNLPVETNKRDAA